MLIIHTLELHILSNFHFHPLYIHHWQEAQQCRLSAKGLFFSLVEDVMSSERYSHGIIIFKLSFQQFLSPTILLGLNIPVLINLNSVLSIFILVCAIVVHFHNLKIPNTHTRCAYISTEHIKDD